jgi:MFS-type transporter involved in bile tolerance (Atg22 family)
MAGRTSSFIGPAVYGWLAFRAALWFQSRGFDAVLAEQQGLRAAVLSIVAFLVVGSVILLSVNVQRARNQSQEA